MFQLSTICKRGFGTKIMFFTYGFTTFIGKKFIDSCSLGLRQMAAKLYRSADRNKDYKVSPSLLLSHPPRGRHTSNRLPLLPATSWPWQVRDLNVSKNRKIRFFPKTRRFNFRNENFRPFPKWISIISVVKRGSLLPKGKFFLSPSFCFSGEKIRVSGKC